MGMSGQSTLISLIGQDSDTSNEWTGTGKEGRFFVLFSRTGVKTETARERRNA